MTKRPIRDVTASACLQGTFKPRIVRHAVRTRSAHRTQACACRLVADWPGYRTSTANRVMKFSPRRSDFNSGWVGNNKVWSASKLCVLGIGSPTS